MSDDDKQLVEALLVAVDGMSTVAAAERVRGVGPTDISRWRRGDWKRLSAKKRRALVAFLEGLRNGGEPILPEQQDLFALVGERLFTKEPLYQTLTSFGGPGEAKEKKLFLVQMLHEIADQLKRDGLMPPMGALADAYRDVLNDEI